jgi:hypothetical protein
MLNSLKFIFLFAAVLSSAPAYANKGPDEIYLMISKYKKQKTVSQRMAQAEKIFIELEKIVEDTSVADKKKVEVISESIFSTYKVDIFNSILTEKIVSYYESHLDLFLKYFEKKEKVAGNDSDTHKLHVKVLKNKMMEFRAEGG